MCSLRFTDRRQKTGRTTKSDTSVSTQQIPVTQSNESQNTITMASKITGIINELVFRYKLELGRGRR
jgi:hypothetical protein